MSVKERIKKFIKAEKMNVSDFEKSIFVKNGYINSISKSVGIDKLNLILEKYPNLSLEWLLTGKGEMLKQECQEQKNDPTNENFLKFLHEENKELNKKIWELEAENERLRKRLKTV
jgi:hypothetical protein